MVCSGGVGKSFLLLALAREVAAFDGAKGNAPNVFGSALAGQGVAIYITAEDDAIEVHNRLNALGPIPDRLYVLPLPDAGGAQPLSTPDGVQTVSVRERWKWGDCFVVVARRKTADERTPALARS